MNEKLSPRAQQQLDSSGYAIKGMIDGEHKQMYWMPDGRKVLAAPDMREWVKREGGRVTASGVRDANLDKWLAQKPEILKPHCPHCDQWHDTIAEVTACGVKRQAMTIKYAKVAKAELGHENDRIDKLEKDMGDIKKLLQQLVERG